VFPPGATLEVGESFVGEDDEGQAVPVRIVELRDDMVMVDANHPLAGVTLYFHVDVREVREATTEELQQGYPNGSRE
jgi:FKBP-type peptidyl-prolyl cis-trans isomerase SlyD